MLFQYVKQRKKWLSEGNELISKHKIKSYIITIGTNIGTINMCETTAEGEFPSAVI